MPNLAQAFCSPRIARVEQSYQVVQNTMAAQHNADGIGGGEGGVGGARVEAGTHNLPNMVAEPGAQLPTGQMSGGGQQVPIPTGVHLGVEEGESEADRATRGEGLKLLWVEHPR